MVWYIFYTNWPPKPCKSQHTGLLFTDTVLKQKNKTLCFTTFLFLKTGPEIYRVSPAASYHSMVQCTVGYWQQG